MKRAIGALLITAAWLTIGFCTVGHAQDDEIPEFSVTADRLVGVEMSETNCNVTFMPEGEGWTLSRIVPDYIGAVCWTGEEAIRWRHHNELDYGKTLVLIIEGSHTSGERRRAAVMVTMEAAPEEGN